MGELEALESRLLESPAARARFLAGLLELLESNGVDLQSESAREGLGASLDLTDGARFLGGLAASTIVITRSSTGRDFGGGTVPPGAAASSVVITRSSTGRQPGGVSPMASTIVVTRSSTGRQPSGASPVASTIVITRSSTGRLGAIVRRLGELSNELATEQSNIESQAQELSVVNDEIARLQEGQRPSTS